MSLSGKERTIEFIWNWYQDQKQALLEFRVNIFKEFVDTTTPSNSKFTTFTSDELNEYFEESVAELEYLVCFDIISATEAFLRVDLHDRGLGKDRSDIGRALRELYKQNKDQLHYISLEDEILEQWKLTFPEKKSVVSDFVGLLKYRHWLAHGRWWTPRLGRTYTPDITYELSEKVFELVNNN